MEDTNAKVERFLTLAEEAEQGGDIETALALISKAALLAPFRTDIREKQATLLEKIPEGEILVSSDAPRPGGHEPVTAHDNHSSPTPRAEDVEARQNIGRHLPLTRIASTEQEPVMGSEAETSDSAPKLVKELRTTANPQTKSSFWAEETNRVANRADLKRESSERGRADKSRQSARGKQKDSSSEDEPNGDLFAGVKNAGRHLSTMKWLARISPAAKASAVVYSTITLFIVVSSTVTYQRFFHDSSLPSRIGASTIPNTQVSAPQVSAKQSAGNDKEALQLLKLAKDYIRQKRYEEAVNLMSGQMERVTEPALRQTFQEELARAYDFLGTALLEKNRLLQSLAAYEKAVRLAPTSSLYLLHLANAHYYCGILLKNENSRQYLELAAQEVAQVLEKEPRNLDAYQLQATICEHTNNIKGAHIALSKIIELAPPTSEEAKLAREKMNKLSFAR